MKDTPRFTIGSLIAAVALIGFGATPAVAQDSESIAEGRQLAQQWCGKCHNIEADGPFKLHPPSFAAMATYRSREQIYSRIVTPYVHGGMPQVLYVLTSENLDVLIDFIQSLEGGAQ